MLRKFLKSVNLGHLMWVVELWNGLGTAGLRCVLVGPRLW